MQGIQIFVVIMLYDYQIFFIMIIGIYEILGMQHSNIDISAADLVDFI